MADSNEPETAGERKVPGEAAAGAPPVDKGAKRAATAGSAPAATGQQRSVPAQVKTRPVRYMVSSKPVLGQLRPMAVDDIHGALDAMDEVTVVRRIRPRGLGVLSTGAAGAGVGHIVVAHMSHERGESLRANAPAGMIVERDHPLRHALPARDSFALLDAQYPVVGQPQRITVDVALKVVGKDGEPVSKATVMVYGEAFPAQGVTDDKGEVVVTVAGGTIDTISAIYVKPSTDFWDRVIMRPHLTDGQSNVVVLHGFAETFPGFPGRAMLGWGQRLMGLDRADPRFKGSGIKIGIIDSGCDNTHPQLRHVTRGADLVLNDGGSGWTNDEISHGTHCAGIIGASSDSVAGISGFAPDAEIHALKVFPGGRFSDLIDALDVAMDRQLDVVNMSLGSDQPSELVQQKLAAVVAAGTACIVASGNSAGPVEYPGAAPQAITVGAIGDLGQYPADSDHAFTLPPEGAGSSGLFSAKFSCFGPEVRLSAPGVAIVSTVPGGGYAAWDGTSMATPHVTGLAALLLAHHPQLRGVARNGRVAALWRVLQSCATPVVADPQRGGAGLPALPPQLMATAGGGTASLAAAAASFVASGGSTGPAAAGSGDAVTPEGILLAELCAHPAILQVVMQRLLHLRSAGVV